MVLPDHVARRKAIHLLYTELLEGLPGVEVKQNPLPEYDSNFWLTYHDRSRYLRRDSG